MSTRKVLEQGRAVEAGNASRPLPCIVIPDAPSHSRASIGSLVRYYDFTSCRYREGFVTAVDVPVLWLDGHPMGIRVDGVTRVHPGRHAFGNDYRVCS